MNEYDARMHKLFERFGLTGLDDCKYIKRSELSEGFQVGVKLMSYIDEKMASNGMTWGLYTIEYFLENKDVITGCKKSYSKEIHDLLNKLIELLEDQNQALRMIAVNTREK